MAPVLFLFIFALVEFSRTVMVQQSLSNAAREGCRVAVLATTTDDDAVEAAAREYLTSTISNASDPNIVTVTVSPSNLTGLAAGTSITVQVQVPFADASWLTLNSHSYLNDIVLGAECTMQRE